MGLRGSDGRLDWGVGLEGLDGGSDWGSDEMAGKISQVSLWFADMSSVVNVVHPMCPSLDKVNFDLGKVTSRSVTVTAEAVTTS